MTDAEWLEKVNSKFNSMSGLHTRMDTDKDLIWNSPYVMPTLTGKGVEPDMSNVTLPIGQLYAEAALSNLISVSRQTVVESKELKDRATSKIEECIDDIGFEIDNRLCELGENDEYSMLVDYICSRGSAAEMSLIRVEKDKFIADARPIDTRWFSWESGADGLAWAAPMYERSKGDIESEFNITIKDETAKVIDLWTPKENKTWVADKLERNNPNVYGFVPIVFQGVSTGSSLKEKNSIQYKWESIFHSNRDLFQEANFIASILKTKNYGAKRPPLQSPNPPGQTRQSLPEKYPAPGEIVSVETALQQIDTGDLKNYTIKYQEIITQLLNQTTFNSIDLGNIEFPLSGTALMALGEKRGKLQLPRLNALAMLLRRSRMMQLKQIALLGQKIKIGEPGYQREYLPSDLEGSFTIKYRFYSLSSSDLAANVALANSMGNLVSEDYKRREVLKLQDPDGEKMKQRAEMAENIDPVIGLIDQGLALIDEDSDESDIKARRIKDKIIGILKQEHLAETQPLKQDIERGSNLKQNPTQALPLFGGTQKAGM